MKTETTSMKTKTMALKACKMWLFLKNTRFSFVFREFSLQFKNSVINPLV